MRGPRSRSPHANDGPHAAETGRALLGGSAARTQALEDAFNAAPTAQAVIETVGRRRLVAVSAAFARMLARTPGDLEQRLLSDLMRTEDPDAAGAALDRLASGASVREPLRVRWTCADGTDCVVNAVFAVPLGEPRPRYALVSLGDPVGELALAAGGDSGKVLQDIIDNVPALVFIKDLDGKYVMTNRRTNQLYGACVGLTRPPDATPDEVLVFQRHDAAVMAAGEPREVEESTVHDGEEHTYYSLKFPLFDYDERPYGLCGVSTDITALKRAESAAREAKNAAEHANRAKSVFLSRISHELRTPLHSILGYTQLLQMQDLSAETSSAVDRIGRAGNHLLGLIDDLLDVSRIEQGQSPMSVAPVHACDPVQEAIDIVRPLAASRDVELATDLHGGLHTFVAADQRRLLQVLINLLANGINYNQPGGEVRASFHSDGEARLRFLVTDTGQGIRRKDFDRVFMPFERLNDDEDGAGLGLAVSKAMVDAMGGRIGIQRSRLGGGTTFFVELPVVPPPSDAHRIVFRTEAPVDAETTRLCGHVLYIEDQVANAELVEQALELTGNVTLSVSRSGEAGLSLAADVRPDLILLDLHLPDMPGERVLTRLRKDDRLASVPVIVVSADATPGRVKRLRDAGAYGYLTKPWDLGEFLRAVGSALNRTSPEVDA